MKMENEIRASFDAAVKSIKVNAKQAVERNEVLMIFE
jgi:biotin carboxyl carrier protein